MTHPVVDPLKEPDLWFQAYERRFEEMNPEFVVHIIQVLRAKMLPAMKAHTQLLREEYGDLFWSLEKESSNYPGVFVRQLCRVECPDEKMPSGSWDDYWAKFVELALDDENPDKPRRLRKPKPETAPPKDAAPEPRKE